MNNYYIRNRESYSLSQLSHHGILGQKWGKKNGPPYPLDAEDHSASEKKAGYKKSIDGNNQPATNLNTINDKYSKKQIDAHRSEMIKQYANKEPEIARLYENLSDTEVAADLRNKEKYKAALIGVAAVVGVSVAVYAGVRLHQTKALSAALTKNPNLKGLLDQGLGIGTANKILTVNAKHKLLNDRQVKEIVKAANNEMDIVIKNARFARADYRADFDLNKANNLLYVAMGERDASVYQQILPNRHTSSGLDKIKQFVIDVNSSKTIKFPSRKKALDMLDDLSNRDPEFNKLVNESWIKMARNNLKNNPFINPNELSDNDLLDIVRNEANIRGTGDIPKEYFLNGALGGADNKLSYKVIKEFNDKGYNAILDAHDMIDKVSDTPVILFNDDITKSRKNIYKQKNQIIIQLIAKKAYTLIEKEECFMAKKELSKGAELYGRIVTGKGTYEDFFSFFAAIGIVTTHSPKGMFELYKHEWESYQKRR